LRKSINQGWGFAIPECPKTKKGRARMCAKCLVQGGFQEGNVTIMQAFEEFIGEKKMMNLSSATLCNCRDSFVEWRNWTIVNWVMSTGSRASTIRAVKLEDVDFVGKGIILRHTQK